MSNAAGLPEISGAPPTCDGEPRTKALGLRPVLLTGANEATARAVAAQAGIAEVIQDAGRLSAASRWAAACRAARRRGASG